MQQSADGCHQWLAACRLSAFFEDPFCQNARFDTEFGQRDTNGSLTWADLSKLLNTGHPSLGVDLS